MAVLASHEPRVTEVHASRRRGRRAPTASVVSCGGSLRRHVSCKVSTNKRPSLDSSLAAQEPQWPSPALVDAGLDRRAGLAEP